MSHYSLTRDEILQIMRVCPNQLDAGIASGDVEQLGQLGREPMYSLDSVARHITRLESEAAA